MAEAQHSSDLVLSKPGKPFCMQNVLDATGSMEMMGPVWEPLLFVGWVTPVEFSLLLPGILKLHSAIAPSVEASLTKVVECFCAHRKYTAAPPSPSIMAHSYNSGTGKAEAGRSWA